MQENRAESRKRNIIKTASSGLLTRIITLSVTLIMVPLSLKYLGKEQYGLWVTISSIIAMMSFMDAGAGNAVLNMIAHESGSNKGNLKQIVSTSFFSLTALAILGIILFLTITPFIPWASLLGLKPDTKIENLDTIILITALSFFISISTTLVGKIQKGLQEGIWDNITNAIGSLLSLFFVYLVILYDKGLIGFVVALLAGPIIAYILSNIFYLFFKRKDIRPSIFNVEKNTARKLFATGGLFFVLQIASVIQGQADNVIISNLLGPSEVSTYAICMKLFLIPPMLFGLILTPLWPAYREAFAGGDMQWIKRIYLKSLKWSLLLSIPSAIFLIFTGKFIINLWAGNNVIPSSGLLVGCGIWLVFNAIGGSTAMLLNGLEIVKAQILMASIASLLNITSTIYLIPIVGAEGAVYGSSIAYLFCVIFPCLFIIKSVFTKHTI